MPLVLVISSYVAASRVGGGIAPYVLGPMKVDPVLVPTCLFGRHPGWGPPGGGAVDASMMERMLEGIEANDLYPMIDAVITGYFSTPEQVAVACGVIDRILKVEDQRVGRKRLGLLQRAFVGAGHVENRTARPNAGNTGGHINLEAATAGDDAASAEDQGGARGWLG